MGDLKFIGAASLPGPECLLSKLPVEEQGRAVEIGRGILSTPEHRAEYGKVLLGLCLKLEINEEQANGLIFCLRNNITGNCRGLEPSAVPVDMQYNG